MPLVLFNTVDSDASENALYALVLAIMNIPLSLLMRFPTLDVLFYSNNDLFQRLVVG